MLSTAAICLVFGVILGYSFCLWTLGRELFKLGDDIKKYDKEIEQFKQQLGAK